MLSFFVMRSNLTALTLLAKFCCNLIILLNRSNIAQYEHYINKYVKIWFQAVFRNCAFDSYCCLGQYPHIKFAEALSSAMFTSPNLGLNDLHINLVILSRILKEQALVLFHDFLFDRFFDTDFSSLSGIRSREEYHKE